MILVKVSLNQKQLEAVHQTEGPLLILAGAGAGKTKTITERIIHIIKKGVAPYNILAITFTNKAAKEMESRVLARLVEEGGSDEYNNYFACPVIKTFHSFGVMVIRENASLLGLTKHFTIVDSGDSLSLIKSAMAEESLDPKQFEPAKLRNMISRYKGDFVDLEDFERGAVDIFRRTLARVWRRYENALQKSHSLDFDDLLVKTVNLLKSHPEIRAHYQERFKYIHVDEYQDTNQVQYELIVLLAEKYKNLCVVGDGDQNIYSWRGANIKNILRFEKDYPYAHVLLLEENYRSSQTILDAANAVIKKNEVRKDKNLFTSRGLGEEISLVQNWDEQAEANFIAREAKKLIAEGVPAREIAVLYRANFQSRVLEEAMLRHDTPYQVLGVRFFERKEVKDIISYLRVALNRDSLPDMKRALETPKRGIGKVTMLKLFQGQSEELPQKMRATLVGFFTILDQIAESAVSKPLSETINFIIVASGIEKELLHGTDDDRERLENIRELVSLATKYDELPSEDALEKFFEESSLVSDQDTDNTEKRAIRLMTVHASKGLEFDVVFIVGLEHDLFPHKHIGSSKPTKEESEEERRLFYVALTRARNKLYLSYADIRTIFGNRQINTPSAFISDIPEHLISLMTVERDDFFGGVVYL